MIKMSNEYDKIKNSKRRYKDEIAVKRQLEIAKENRLIDSNEPHKYHKRHAMNCGNSRCYLCSNPRKVHKDKLTQQEKRLFQDIDSPNDRRSNGLKND
jgi:hypothetical protein